MVFWKKANVVPIHKKESKNLLKNYRPISLLPIFGKIYERIIFKELFNHFHQNQLFTKCQSGFSLVIHVFLSYCIGSVLGPLLFLIYINDLSDNLKSNCKIFADDTSLFYKVFDKHVSRATLNKDLELINNWAFQWKCSSIQTEIGKLKNYIFLKKLVIKNR